jgi:PAS domain-containing protein
LELILAAEVRFCGMKDLSKEVRMRASTNPTERGATVADEISKQTSFRLDPGLHQVFRKFLSSRNRKMNAVINELVQGWIENPSSGSPQDHSQYIVPYLSWLPGVAVIKDSNGHISYANGKFNKLVGKVGKNVVGMLPRDYVEDPASAALIEELDKVVRKEKTAILCIERLKIRGEIRRRMAIRFPIPPEGDLLLTGVIGFDLEQFEKATDFQLEVNDTSPREFETEFVPAPTCALHCLKYFLHSVPAIATVKNLDGRLLCVNAEYTKILGKERNEVEGLHSTQIWPQSFARLIIAHDSLVRKTRKPYFTVENVPTRTGLRDRLNIRFPIFAGSELTMTGTLGFDFELIRNGLRLLRDHATATRAYVLPSSQEAGSFKFKRIY